MIQRIQTIFLLITAVALAVFLATNSWTATGADNTVLVNPYQIIQTKGALAAFKKEIFYVAVMAVLSIALSIFTIFQFKNRLRQMMLVALNSLLIGVAVATLVYHVKYDAMTLDGVGEGTFGIGLYAGFVALVANWIARRFIGKDEKLVKDADRMR